MSQLLPKTCLALYNMHWWPTDLEKQLFFIQTASDFFTLFDSLSKLKELVTKGEVFLRSERASYGKKLPSTLLLSIFDWIFLDKKSHPLQSLKQVCKSWYNAMMSNMGKTLLSSPPYYCLQLISPSDIVLYDNLPPEMIILSPWYPMVTLGSNGARLPKKIQSNEAETGINLGCQRSTPNKLDTDHASLRWNHHQKVWELTDLNYSLTGLNKVNGYNQNLSEMAGDFSSVFVNNQRICKWNLKMGDVVMFVGGSIDAKLSCIAKPLFWCNVEGKKIAMNSENLHKALNREIIFRYVFTLRPPSDSWPNKKEKENESERDLENSEDSEDASYAYCYDSEENSEEELTW